MALRPLKRDGFTVLPPGAFAGTLVGKLISPVDKLRNLLTVAGLRPYIVRLVTTRWSGGTRDEGVEQVVKEQLILPTPKISNLDAIDSTTNEVGTEEYGSIQISQISARYTEYELSGRGPNGEEIPADTQFYWEIEFPGINGRYPGIRRRFESNSAPNYNGGKFEWTIKVVRAGEDRLPDGTPED